jgi:hypothetical protein
MKSFLKEIESKFQNLQEKDWDGDGEVETPKDEYMGVKDKAIKKAMKKEDAKPDFLDLDNDGDTEEDMKDAAANEVTYKVKDAKDLPTNLKNDDVVDLTEDELDEQNVTGALDGGAGPPRTPYAFGKKKRKYTYASVSEAMDQKYAAMIESYSKFATGNPKSTPSQTVNGTIKEVAKKLQEIEQLIKYTSRLKNESGIAGSEYGRSTHNALKKISERLLKISERVRSLGE